jgi:hypothetical protein
MTRWIPQVSSPIVRSVVLNGPDAKSVSRLVQAYLIQAEREKATYLGDTSTDADLPERYRQEVEYPACAYEGATVYVAELGNSPVRVVIVQQTAEAREIKRVWVDRARECIGGFRLDRCRTQPAGSAYPSDGMGFAR